MRNLKRFLAMTLTMLMVIGCFSFASFAQTFDDVSEHQTAIDVLSDLGVIWGYEDGTFGPDNAVERWHMTLWIAKMETGKVTTDDYLTIWRAEENYTDFTDVVVDQAIGAINYASDEGITIGTSATTFTPTAGIMYQDALTMVVRALGYGSKAMDAGYPWKFISKAAELGLEDGITGVAYKDGLTRGETAQILYNALYVVDADGATYASDVFGLSTVVITGTPAFKITQTEAVIKTGFVSFNILNGDGTINTDVTYHLPATAFGLTAANADNYVGASFKVTTTNNFKTLGIAIENPSEVFAAADIVGAGAAGVPSASLTLKGTSYQAVNKFSALYNTQGIKGNTDEILVYTTNLVQSTADGYFKVDSSYNVLNVTGQIVAYYAPAITGSYAAPYVKLLGNNTYSPFANANDNQKASIVAAGGVWNATVQNTYKQSVDTYDLVINNKYSSAKAYDDNNDGMYDRLFYTYQEFCNISLDAATVAVANDYVINGGTVVVLKFIDGTTGAEIVPAPTTGYIRYSYNPLSKYLTVYETYKSGTGLVTSVNTATPTIVIGGTQYTVGFGNFPGAAYVNSVVGITLIGKQVNFILVDGVVVRVFDATVDTRFIVYDNMTGITSQGYGTALVYVQSQAASVITIATINGYSFQQYWLFAEQGSLANIMPLVTGDLFIGTKDALGFWHLKTQVYTYKATQGTIEFTNGIGTGLTPAMAPFETAADTVYIVYDATSDRFYTRKGVPTDTSTITVNGKLFFNIVTGTPTANFLYANTGSFNSNFNIQAAPPVFASSDTVIYVNKSAVPTLVTNNIGTTGTLLGNTYQYGNVLDMITGKLVTVQANYNFTLEGGCFYRVYNGYIEGKVVPDVAYDDVAYNDEYSFNNEDSNIDIRTGSLISYTAYSSTIDPTDTLLTNNIANSKKTYIYKLVAGDVYLDPVTLALVNYAVPPLAALNSKVTYYTGPNSNRVMLIDAAGIIPSATTNKVTILDPSKIFVGDTLTANIAGLPAGAVTYQWMKSNAVDGGLNYYPITGATSSTWKLLADDFSSYIKVKVTVAGYTEAFLSDPIGPIHAHGTNTIVYMPNTGIGEMLPTTANYAGASVILRTNTFKKAGYTFAGWLSNSSTFSDAQTIAMPADGLILFAQWTALPQTIAYNANSGIGTMANTIGNTADPVTLATNLFTKAGYTFTGWNTAALGTGTAYANMANITTMPVGGLVLYAQWAAAPHTIAYNANSGIGTMANTIGNTAASVTLATNTFTRTGYTFAGWNTAGNGIGGTAYADQTTFNMPASGLILFAQWTALPQTIAYNANGGSGSMAPQTSYTGASVTLTNTFTKTGYTFVNWNTAANGSGTNYLTYGQTIIPAGGLTLYAVWAKIIWYNANNGIGNNSGYYVFGDSVTLKVNTFTRAGYNFAGWNTAANGTGISYTDGQTITMPTGSELSLFAQWTAVTQIPLTSISVDVTPPDLTSVLLPAGAAATATYKWYSSATEFGTFTLIPGETSATLTNYVAFSSTPWFKVEATGTGAYSGIVTSPAK